MPSHGPLCPLSFGFYQSTTSSRRPIFRASRYARSLGVHRFYFPSRSQSAFSAMRVDGNATRLSELALRKLEALPP